MIIAALSMMRCRAASVPLSNHCGNALFSTWIDGYRHTAHRAGSDFNKTMTNSADGEIVQFDNVGLRYGTGAEALKHDLQLLLAQS